MAPLFYYFVAIAAFTATIVVITTEPNRKPSEEFNSFSELRLKCLAQENSEREELLAAVKFLTLEKVQNRLRQEEGMKGLGIAAIIFSVGMLVLFNMSPVSCSSMDQRTSRLAGKAHLLMMERFRKIRDEALEEVRKEMEGEAGEQQEEEENEGGLTLAILPRPEVENDVDQLEVMSELKDPHSDDDHPVLNIANSVVYINTASAPPSPHRGPSQGQLQLHHSW